MTSLQISQYSLYTIENYNANLNSTINDILNKYKVKLSFLVDNQEQATVST